MVHGGCIYIVTNYKCTVLYTGVTSNLYNRILQHKRKKYPNSFSARYNCNILIYYEMFSSIVEAIEREKYIKGKSRQWKEELIKTKNPSFSDLWDEIKDW